MVRPLNGAKTLAEAEEVLVAAGGLVSPIKVLGWVVANLCNADDEQRRLIDRAVHDYQQAIDEHTLRTLVVIEEALEG